MKYLIININNTSNENLAKALSSALWDITRPDKSIDDTQYYCGWINNADNTLWALEFIEGDTQPININAEQNILNLGELLSLNISLEEKELLEQTLLDARGSRVNIVEVLPQTLKNNLMAEEQIKVYGFLSDEEEIIQIIEVP